MNILLEQFKTIFDRPEKVKKLRQYILQLAVRGKLVEQDENDEPASVLLEKIKEEKERLIKEKKIKKQKALPEISQDEIPYELPKGWKWARLGEIGDWGAGSTPARSKPEYYNGNISWLKTGELNDGYITSSVETITELALKDYSLRMNQPGDILIAMYGATIGKLGVLKIKAATNQACCACTTFKGIYNIYLYYTLLSMRQIFRSKGAGGAQPNISRQKIISTMVSLPPLNEQKRIVKKVDSLMLLCDKLEEYLESKVKYGTLSSKSVFNSIGNCKSSDELEEALKFIIMNFKELTLGDNAVKEFKNAILQLAIQGKLVPQNESDEPAGVLLEKIKEEKEKLIKEKKIKKQKALPEISEDEIPYELPKGWEWGRLDDICMYIQRGKSPKYSEQVAVPVISQKCVQWNGFDIEKARFIEPETLNKYTEERFIEQDDLLWNSTGKGTLGRINVFPSNIKYKQVVVDSHVTVIRPFKEYILSKYLYFWFAGPKIQSEIESRSTGSTKQIELNTTTVKSYIVPIPPLNEQKRIVEKVDSLMVLCDELEKRIENSKKYSEKLMESIFKKSFIRVED